MVIVRIGYTSIGFINYNMEKCVEFLKHIGYDSIELIYYPENWNRHVPSPQALKEKCNQIGLDILSFRFISGTDEKSLMEGERLIDLAYSLDCKIVDVKIESPTPDKATENDYNLVVNAMSFLGRYTVKKGMKLVVETHPGVLHESAQITKMLIKKTGLPDIYVNYDQANLSYSGQEETEKALEILKDNIGFCHLKNGWFRDKSPVWTSLEDGKIDTFLIVSTLLKRGYDSDFMIEMPSGGDPFIRAVKDYKYLKGIESLIDKYNF